MKLNTEGNFTNSKNGKKLEKNCGRYPEYFENGVPKIFKSRDHNGATSQIPAEFWKRVGKKRKSSIQSCTRSTRL